jgi:hypothetical protein
MPKPVKKSPILFFIFIHFFNFSFIELRVSSLCFRPFPQNLRVLSKRSKYNAFRTIQAAKISHLPQITKSPIKIYFHTTPTHQTIHPTLFPHPNSPSYLYRKYYPFLCANSSCCYAAS